MNSLFHATTSFLGRCLLIVILLCSWNACTQQEPAKSPEAAVPSPPAPATSAAPALPSISNEMVKHLWENTNFLDYTFYTLPLSMSFDNAPAIQNVLSHLEPTPVALLDSCKPTGRAFFQRDGEDLAIAEFYLHTDCRCFVFYKDGKPAYSNRINDKGIGFYQNSIRQAAAQQAQQPR